MLTRVGKPSFDGLHDIVKQFLNWVPKNKRKFSSAKIQYYFHDDFEDGHSSKRENRFKNGNREGNMYGYRNRNMYNDRRRNIFKNNSFDIPLRSVINWDSLDLKPIQKDYQPHPDVLQRSEEEINKFYQNHEIKIFGRDCPAPIFNFSELRLPESVCDYLSSLNYSQPTPIQSVTWPVALSGRDMVGISRTGSGKTFGFILPAIVHIKNQPKLEINEGPIVLVLAPTRELVQQIQSVANPIGRVCSIRTVSMFGGASKISQMNELSSVSQIYIATPGRLLDFLSHDVVNLNRCSFLVLDEADEMLNMGFEPQIRNIISRIRPDRQVLMWSATWPKDIQDLAKSYLKNYIKVQVGSGELNANPNIIQVVHVCEESDKMHLLINILNKIKKEDESKTLIFANTKFGVEKVARALNGMKINVRTLHGDHSQNQRNKVMENFKTRRNAILVATNVAGRGLDVTDIKYVINYDFPNTVEEYVHKIGRTARKDTGTAHTFFTPQNAALGASLISILESTNQIVSPELRELADRHSFGRRHRFQHSDF